jgi:nitrogenase molybdenum-iron protein NifN
MNTAPAAAKPLHTATRNACKLCAPLGAALVFKGIAGAVPLLHGSQGCSTYIRRYVIGHFREPIDIASSSFSEETTIFGGGDNLRLAIANIIEQYHPALIGIATTCLAETIGEDVGMHLRGLSPALDAPPIVHVNTPAYHGTHTDGFHRTVYTLVDRFAHHEDRRPVVALFPGMISPADMRHLKSIIESFRLQCIMVPDYSETLDGGIWNDYQTLPEGGTTIGDLIASGSCSASIEFCTVSEAGVSAGTLLEKKCGVPSVRSGMPVGIDACDRFFGHLSAIAGIPVPSVHTATRQRLVDAYVDGHKFVAGKRVAIYGDEDLAPALVRFATEIGMKVSVIVSGCSEKIITEACSGILKQQDTVVAGDADFEDLAKLAEDTGTELLIGSSKGYRLARTIGIPLVRIGFPVHDRIGAQRIVHCGYEGTLQLFDRIVNAIIEHEQSGSDVGYMTW